MEHVPTGLEIGLEASRRMYFKRSADGAIDEESQVFKGVVKVKIGVEKRSHECKQTMLLNEEEDLKKDERMDGCGSVVTSEGHDVQERNEV